MDLYRMEICSLFGKASTCFYLEIKDYIHAVFRELSLLSGHASYFRLASRLTPLTNRKHKDET